jgi:hypoxanthine phosphoribosyltransferase
MAENSPYRKTYAISWEQLHRDAKALAWRLLDRGYFQGILAITRGGLVPAAIVARELDIHLVDTICISSYDWKNKKGEAEVLKGFNGDGAGWLLVDDLVDTGRTARIVRDMVHNLRQAGRPRTGGHLHHRGQPGHLDTLPLGRRVPVRPAAGDRPLADDGADPDHPPGGHQ